MVGGVVHHVLNHVPQPVAACGAIEQPIVEGLVQSLVSQGCGERAHFRFQFRPAGADGRHIRKAIGRERRGRRLAVPA